MRHTLAVAAAAVGTLAIFLGIAVMLSSNVRSMTVVAGEVGTDADYMLDTINDWSWRGGLPANEF